MYLKYFINLLYPNLCVACEKSLLAKEKILCTDCLTSIPLTNFWNQKDNPVEQLFWGRVKLENAASFIYYEKNSRYQNALHQLKYFGKKETGIQLGKLFGNYLIGSRYDSVDAIIPVPLHKKKLKKRGYNQSEMIAIGLGAILQKQLITKSLIRKNASSSQTNKNRFERWKNVEDIFECTKPETIQNKHILLVDDVITTGATAESVISELLKVKGVRVSLVSIASA